MKASKTILLCLLLIIGISYYLVNSFSFLVNVAGISDSPSLTQKIALERIYKLPVDDIREGVISDLKNNERSNLINTYIRISSVVGIKDLSTNWMQLYTEIQDDPNYRSTIYFIITALGLFDDNKFVPVLDTLLENYDSHNMQVGKDVIARSLFLLTGRKYNLSTENRGNDEIHLTEKLITIRKVLEESTGRNRTYKEKLILDKLYQPSDCDLVK